jgi:hypothetical protein
MKIYTNLPQEKTKITSTVQARLDMRSLKILTLEEQKSQGFTRIALLRTLQVI